MDVESICFIVLIVGLFAIGGIAIFSLGSDSKDFYNLLQKALQVELEKQEKANSRIKELEERIKKLEGE